MRNDEEYQVSTFILYQSPELLAEVVEQYRQYLVELSEGGWNTYTLQIPELSIA